jgi:hypothetical protein
MAPRGRALAVLAVALALTACAGAAASAPRADTESGVSEHRTKDALLQQEQRAKASELANEAQLKASELRSEAANKDAITKREENAKVCAREGSWSRAMRARVSPEPPRASSRCR